MKNASYKFIALLIALGIWATVLNRRDVLFVKTVPLSFVVADHQVLSTDVPLDVEVRFSGSRAALGRLTKKEFQPLVVDLSEQGFGEKIVQIPEESIQIPTGIKIVGVFPQTVLVQLQQAISQTVTVHAGALDSEILKDAEVIRVIPQQLSLRGTAEQLRLVTDIPTQPITLPPTFQDAWKQIPLGGVLEVPIGLQLQRGVRVAGHDSKFRVIVELRKLQFKKMKTDTNTKKGSENSGR